MLDWSSASDYCKDRNMIIATFESRAEASFFSSRAGKEVWVGANDIQEENNFVQLDFVKNPDIPWNSGEPNDANNNEDCVQTYNGGYQDNGCFKQFKFGCEWIEYINIETLTTEVPTTELPTTETPTTELPTTEAPTTELPTTESPTTELPTTEAPTTLPLLESNLVPLGSFCKSIF
jgi:hypothetical protein